MDSPTSEPERGQHLRTDERALVLEERVRIGLSALEHHAAVQRKRGFHGFELDHPRNRPGLVRRPHHRGRRNRFRAGDGLRLRQPTVDQRLGLRRQIAIRVDDDVRGDERLRFPAEDLPHVLNHRAQRDDRRHADGDADEEEQQPAPGGPRFANRHLQDEAHACLSSSYVFNDAAVPKDQPRIGDRRQLRVVRDQNDRRSAHAMNLAEQLQNMTAGGGVEVPRRLVRQNDRRGVGQRARERNPLLLASRQLRRVVMRAAGQSNLLEQRLRPGAARRPRRRFPSGPATFSNAVSDGIR